MDDDMTSRDLRGEFDERSKKEFMGYLERTQRGI
jgi:hypothetical protein